MKSVCGGLSAPFIPATRAGSVHVDAIREHGEGLGFEGQFGLPVRSGAGPAERAPFQTFEARNTLRQEATSLIFIG